MLIYHKKYILLLFLSSLSSRVLISQNLKNNFVQYTRKDGLSSNETYCVIEDKKGYIWISADKGVVRYNGNKFQKIDLPDNVVFKIKESDDGKIWFFTYTGRLSYFFNEKIYSYQYNDTIQKYAQRLLISDAYIFPNNELYIKSINKYDYFIDRLGHIKLIENDRKENNQVPMVFIDNYKNNRLFIRHINNPSFKSKENYTIQDIRLNNSYKINIKTPSIIKFSEGNLDSKGNVYLSLQNWFVKITMDGKVMSKNLTNQIVSTFYNIKQNLFYFGLENNGFSILDEELTTLYSNKLNGETVSSICNNFNNDIWVTTNSNGAYKIENPLRGKILSNWLNNESTTSICKYNSNIYLFSTANGINFFENGNSKKLITTENKLTSDLIHLSKKTFLWISPENNISQKAIQKAIYLNQKVEKLIKLNIKTKPHFLCDSSIVIVNPSGLMFYPKNIDYENLTNEKIKEIYKNDKNSKDPKNKFTIKKIDSIFVKNISILNCDNILMGTLNNLYRYNIPTNKANIHIPQTTIFQKGVNYITPFKNNTQAIAIRFGGLALIKDTTVIANITEPDGILDNSITYILPDSNKLWLASSKGLSCITFQSLFPVKYTIKNFGKEVGLGNEIIYQIIRFKKDILAATSKGIFKLNNVDSLLALPPKPIPFYVTTISTYLGDTTNITSISLPHNKNRVSINFDAIEFTTPTDIEYYYHIVNSDSTWFSISNPQLILQDLSPGTYLVELKAILPKQGRTSEIKQITITIEKPWWLKTISLTTFALGLIGLLYLFSNWRIKKAKKEAQEKNEIATKMLKLEQNALQAQMNPHFIFNCLTGIQQLMNNNNIDEANEYLVTFSRLIRRTLENSSPRVYYTAR